MSYWWPDFKGPRRKTEDPDVSSVNKKVFYELEFFPFLQWLWCTWLSSPTFYYKPSNPIKVSNLTGQIILACFNKYWKALILSVCLSVCKYETRKKVTATLKCTSICSFWILSQFVYNYTLSLPLHHATWEALYSNKITFNHPCSLGPR